MNEILEKYWAVAFFQAEINSVADKMKKALAATNMKSNAESNSLGGDCA